jgi:hypothetical protein
VKERARREDKGAGEVLSELARQALNSAPVARGRPDEPKEFYGFDPFPHRGKTLSNDLIDKLLEEEP